ncbi:pentatricopeptide repeat-containing protein At3g09040, mitochondrial isoform X1 [Selaginella moellendorffii]|uniref:pentatricopeptide repeat-containing protein At3g09040, mitochondrial isoform X1 n=1 Tax=Selaginella moellendorffii TaxID=88036 RepID=UPI000D1C3760|nr:pentatricopeptide repeat-containing protein At3g09040, mitochondrial isoform X1 [Selaginella moellendorffii]|eukprot:XP_024522536.1 pentatricopeptide repeat-containing protein At3g09040, mitochondrial isoform X1 [Selaginella moellendorffii]
MVPMRRSLGSAMQRQALQMLDLNRIDLSGLRLNRDTSVWLLRQCDDLEQGRRIHSELARTGIDSETLLGNTLVQMYGKCGSLAEARAAFDGIAEKNVFSWSIIIGLYSRHRLEREAIELFHAMDVRPNCVTFINTLGACSSAEFLETGKKIHAQIVAGEVELELNLANSLISMYSNCGSLVDAKRFFDGMNRRNVVSWNCIIAAFSGHGHYREAVDLFYEMEKQGFKPDRVSFVSVFSACSILEDLSQGRRIHARFCDGRMKLDVSIGNTLLNMYARCGSLGDARSVFDSITSRNIVSWTSMIAAYAQFDRFHDAYEVFQKMGVAPNDVTFITILGACAEARALKQAREIHSLVLTSGILEKQQLTVGNSLINTYAKCGSLSDAKTVFESMATAERNVVTWTSIIAACGLCGHPREALALFHRMELEGIPANEITFGTVLSACADLGSTREARCLHGLIVSGGYDRDTVVCNGLINMFGKCGMVEDARAIFERMRSRNLVTWTGMLGAYIQQQEIRQAVSLFQQMEVEGITPNIVTMVSIIVGCSSSNTLELDPLEAAKSIHRSCIVGTEMEADTLVGTAVVDMYVKSGDMIQAREAFERISYKDVMAWTTMVAAYAQAGYADEALKLYARMGLEGVAPDEITFVNLLHACSRMGAKKEGWTIHSHILERGLPSSRVLGNGLVCFYGACGTWLQAKMVFENLSERDAAAWNAAIGVSGQHGFYDESLRLFERMVLEGMEPDEITFTNVLFSCSHSGEIERAWRWFLVMRGDHGMEPNVEHWGCLADLFGRLGWIDEAERLVSFLPRTRASIAWTTLLSGCKVHGDVSTAERAAERAMAVDPSKSSPYVLLSHLYRCGHLNLAGEFVNGRLGCV